MREDEKLSEKSVSMSRHYSIALHALAEAKNMSLSQLIRNAIHMHLIDIAEIYGDFLEYVRKPITFSERDRDELDSMDLAEGLDECEEENAWCSLRKRASETPSSKIKATINVSMSKSAIESIGNIVSEKIHTSISSLIRESVRKVLCQCIYPHFHPASRTVWVRLGGGTGNSEEEREAIVMAVH